MENQENYYLVEQGKKEDVLFVYLVKRELGKEHVFLVKTIYTSKNPLFLGCIEKETKRGWTFLSFFIDTNGTSIFLDRSKFLKMSEKEYLKINK